MSSTTLPGGSTSFASLTLRVELYEVFRTPAVGTVDHSSEDFLVDQTQPKLLDFYSDFVRFDQTKIQFSLNLTHPRVITKSQHNFLMSLLSGVARAPPENLLVLKVLSLIQSAPTGFAHVAVFSTLRLRGTQVTRFARSSGPAGADT